MANKLISELDAKTTDASGNMLALFQVGDSTTRRMTWAQFAAWQATYMIDNSLISAGGGDFYKDGSIPGTASFYWSYTDDGGSQVYNSATPTSARLRLKNWDTLIGWTTNADPTIRGTYISTDAAFSIYNKVGAVVFKMARFSNKDWYMPTADASTEVRVPRTFIQATEPSAALCAEGDIWIWG